MVLGTGENDILFYFRDQANNGTRSIPCEGNIFGANVDTCSLGELQYQRDMFINS